MSKRRDRQAELKSIKKFLEFSKDPIKRLKSLKHGLEKSTVEEIKAFYLEHSSTVFYCIFSSFTVVEANIHDRVIKGKGFSEVFLRDLLELVLPALQKVLVFLPELIHRRWQFNSICLIVRKLMHPKNNPKVRQYGIKLLVLWVQALQENAGDACMELFAAAIPHFPPEKTPLGLPTPSTSHSSSSSSLGLCDRYGVYSSSSLSSQESTSSTGPLLFRAQSSGGGATTVRDMIQMGVIYPLSPPPAEDEETLTIDLMDYLLKCLTSQLHCLHWEDPSQYVRGFAFLFFLFKLFYLAPLYKEFRTEAGLYTQAPLPDLKMSQPPSEDEGLHSVQEESSQDSTDQVTPTATPPLSGSSHLKYKRKRSSPYRMSSVIKLEYNTSDPIYAKVQDSILKYILMWVLPSSRTQRGCVAGEGISNSPAPSPLLPRKSSFVPSGLELMQEMWFTNRDNVSLLLEICRVGIQTSLSQAPTLRKLIELYFHWEQTAQKPLFMHPPPVQSYGETTPLTATAPSTPRSSKHSESLTGTELLQAVQSRPSILSWEQLSCYEGFKPMCVQAGIQASLRMIVTHTCQVFLKKAENQEELNNQVEMCRKILRLYQDIATSWVMDHNTWEYTLAVLLHLTVETLRGDPPLDRASTLGGVMADLLLRTLLVYYLRASIVTKVSSGLWNNLLAVMASLTQWREVVKEWQFVMSSMTKVLAQTVYNLNLSELPLDLLENEDTNRTRRTRLPTVGPKELTSSIRIDSFSKIVVVQPSRVPQRRDTADGHVRHTHKEVKSQTKPARKPLLKSATEDVPDSPKMDGHPGKHKRPSMPTTNTSPVNNPITTLGALPEEKQSSGITSPPLRSISAIGVVITTKDEGLLAPDANPSPGAVSLPVEFILEQSEEKESQILPNKEETRKGSLFVNPDINTPSPDSLKDMAFSDRKTEGNKESTSQRRPASKKKALFRHREAKTKLARDRPSNDLVLRNENLSDSELESPKSKPGRSKSDTPSLFESPLTQSMNVTDSPDFSENRKRITIRKSSSEGNIHRIAIPHDRQDYPSPGSAKDDNTHARVIRRVASTNVNHHEDSAMTYPNAFSDEIVPHMLSPTCKSPGLSSEIESNLDSRTRGGVSVGVAKSPGSPPLSPSTTQSSVMWWTPVTAALVWQRMLKILGDVNNIHDPEIHSEAMTCLQETWKSLVDICSNLGLPVNNAPTPPLPDYVPHLSILLPWVVKACSLPKAHFGGRVKAYQLLCQMMVRHWHSPPPQSHLTHFYKLMHRALQPNSDMLNFAVKYGCKMFCYSLPGSSILLKDSINAAATILSSTTNNVPRNDALHLLGSLLCLPDLYPSVPVLGASCDGGEGCSGEEVGTSELKEKIVQVLYQSAKTEPVRYWRCLALYQVGVLLFTELQAGNTSNTLSEGLDILLASLQFSDRNVSMAAVDMLSLLAEVAPQVHTLYPSLPAKILEAICYAIAVFMSDELENNSWVDKVIVTLILCLRDWLMSLPTLQLLKTGALTDNTIKTVFEVLQSAAGSCKQFSSKQLFTIKNPVSVQLDDIDLTNSRSPRGGQSGRSSKDIHRLRMNGEDVQLSSERLSHSLTSQLEEKDRIQIAARSVITHLVNLLGHFPFACGTAQMSSVVSEYHDSPSLQHLDELSTEIFDSPRVQFFSFNDASIVTFVEIPTKLAGVPGSIKTANYQSRLIMRDVSGKYAWDCAVLYGPETPPSQDDHSPSLTKAESMDSLVEYLNVIPQPPHVPDPLPITSDPLEPPSWKSHINTDRDVLEDLLLHVEKTSPECLLHPGQVGLCEAVSGEAVSGEAVSGGVEEQLVQLLDHQHSNEQLYVKESQGLLSTHAEKSTAPQFFPSSLAFHHCRLFLAHLGMLSWERRGHLDLLEKSNQLILELKHLDNIQAQTRQTYKVAVIYIAPGQEDKRSIFSNSSGSRDYEEFVAGLGWEVEMKSHSGYMGGLKRDFIADCTLPYYASSSEEVLFHVSTRLPLKMDQKVRHLGNDEVHIVWSEHWRDYRRTIFKTQFADVLLVIYPQTNGLFRVQINKKRKTNVPRFGPLFDGALVNRESLPALVRATAINGLRAQRSPLIGYRGRYEERLRNIQTITNKKLLSSFEQFSENVMHPLEMTSAQPTMTSSLRASPQKPLHNLSTPISIPSVSRFHQHSHSHLPHDSHKGTSTYTHTSNSLPRLSPHTSEPSHSPKGMSLMSSFLKLPSLAMERAVGRASPPARRARASTNDDRMQASPRYRGMRRNSSVPENLSEIGKTLGSKSEPTTPQVLKSSAAQSSKGRTSDSKKSMTHSLTSSMI